ncbi:MAG: hypothetical protein GY854_09455, partial [Deltaproteobacteria bacterium]|nr:hypothetical protein [Deltaproteobacteria bacterium]
MKWILIGGAYSLINSVYQVTVTRVLTYLSPLHMLASLSLLLTMGIVFSGLGALFSRSTLNNIKTVSVFTAFSIPASFMLFFLSADLLATRLSALSTLAIALPIIALPLTLLGAVSGACFIAVLRAESASVKPLIALAGISFFIGYLGSSLLVATIGLFGLVFSTALLALAPIIRRRQVAYLLVVAALLVLPLDMGDRVFSNVKNNPKLWWGDNEEVEFVGGSWSPYARIDFYYKKSGNLLAGVYNGMQQWSVSPDRNINFDIRSRWYKTFKGDILLIGAGGGQGVQALTDARSVTAVELDATVLGMLRGELSKYNANAYNQSKVEAIAGDGRTYIDRTERMFDTIILEGADANISHNKRSLISMENYLYTVEGLDTFSRHLDENGLLIVILATPDSVVQKIVKGLGGRLHYSTWRGTAVGNDFHFPYRLILAARSKHILDEQGNWLELSGCIVENTSSMEVFAPGQLAKARAITDSSPFLYYHSPDQLIPFALVFACLIVALSALMSFTKPRRLSCYFVFVGAAFIATELLLINYMRSFLGGYLETSACIIGMISISYALGNLYSERIGWRGLFSLTICSFITMAALLLFAPFGANYVVRIIWLAGACVPSGFAMGLFMPRGMLLADSDMAGRFYAIDTLGSAAGIVFFYLSSVA